MLFSLIYRQKWLHHLLGRNWTCTKVHVLDNDYKIGVPKENIQTNINKFLYIHVIASRFLNYINPSKSYKFLQKFFTL